MRYVLLVFVLGVLSPAFAQAQYDRINMPVSHPEIAFEDGWKFTTRLGVAADWELNQNKPGVSAGHFLRLGGSLKLAAVYLEENHEWRNKLVFAEMFTKTPVKTDFLKSHDRLAFETLYLWSFIDWLGAYGRFNVETTALFGEDVQDDFAVYRVYAQDGSSSLSQPISRLRLTDALKPLYLNESVGIFARLMNMSSLTLEAKVGGYALQAFANGQRRLDGPNGAGELEVRPLGDFYHIGPTLGLFFFGDLVPEVFFYQLNADFGYSAYQSAAVTIGSSFSDRLYFVGSAEVTFKLFEWLQLNYEVRTVRIPEVTTYLQFDNRLNAEFLFSL